MDKSRLVARVIRQAGAAAAIAAAATAVLVVPAGASTGTAMTADPDQITCRQVAGPDGGRIRGIGCQPELGGEEEGVIVRGPRRSFFCQVVYPVGRGEVVGEGCVQI